MLDHPLLENIAQMFAYDKKAPLLFNSGEFLVLFTAFLSIYLLIYQQKFARVLYVLAFSLFFYYKSSGIYVLNLVVLAVVDYYAALWLSPAKEHPRRKLWLVLLIIFNLSFLLYFKYTNFILDNIAYLAQKDFKKLDIFLPIGVSFYTFQTISYLVDVYKGEIKPCRNLMDFGFYLSFFPQLVAGPIVRAKDFLPQINQDIVFRRDQMGDGLFMILKGLVKKALIANYVAQYADLIYGAPGTYSGFENLMAMYAYTLQIYCDFSGYSDMAIGLALLMGFRLPDNFRSPYNSLSITEFWRRWHISLSTWLRDYIYIPMGGNRKGEEKQWLFLMLTMLIGGFWHGASWKFVFWGAMHGAGLFVHKIFSKTVKDMGFNRQILRPLDWFVTFHFVALLWVFFRAESFVVAFKSITQMAFHTDWAYLIPFMQTRGALLAMMVAGFAIHFISEKDKERMAEYFGTLPVLAKAAVFVLVIQLILQFQTENVQPFIYFQF
ncbi:MBOAT family protein [uncultured Microscilla sp.]|uniref:MBOAT family O-acyltransferase n=1 Tax=uncultured Microscilla sp. TaxID=432653 RepID=UPI00261AAA2B|nr:MBOAT family protein [uncultured Microscilla sp.]